MGHAISGAEAFSPIPMAGLPMPCHAYGAAAGRSATRSSPATHERASKRDDLDDFSAYYASPRRAVAAFRRYMPGQHFSQSAGHNIEAARRLRPRQGMSFRCGWLADGIILHEAER